MALTKFQENQLKKFNPKKPVYFQQEVEDCEHWGDMRRERQNVEDFIGRFGGHVTDEFWDGRDCGEAFIECCVPYANARAVMETKYFLYDAFQR